MFQWKKKLEAKRIILSLRLTDFSVPFVKNLFHFFHSSLNNVQPVIVILALRIDNISGLYQLWEEYENQNDMENASPIISSSVFERTEEASSGFSRLEVGFRNSF